ncbi:MAG: hypothetical protein EOP05_02865 [Proteobacteria bacterium]|nr:MAG: hypothetical protein EOP05_02865 [Pseudomonadota bacterium]
MRKLLICLSLYMLAAVSSVALAGPISSGGGGAVVCRSPQGGFISAELLDLYEAREVYGLKARDLSGSTSSEYFDYLENRTYLEFGKSVVLSQREKDRAHSFLIRTLSRFKFQKKSSMPQSNDWGSVPMFPKGCALEQLAYFDDVKLITHINRDLWVYLPARDRVALYVHEYYYRKYRLAGEQTSEAVRKLVGLVFSSGSQSVIDGLPEHSIFCLGSNSSGDETSFYIRPDELNGSRSVIQFMEVFGRRTFSPTQVTIDQEIDLSQLEPNLLNGVIVRNPQANFNSKLKLINGPLAGRSIAIAYENNKPFKIGWKDEGSSRSQVTVRNCELVDKTKLGGTELDYNYIDRAGEIAPELKASALSFYHANSKLLSNKRYLTIIDFGRPSSEKRLFVIDILTGNISSTFVSHGIGSDPQDTGWATQFGNAAGSKMSPLGFIVASEMYETASEKKLRLDGLQDANSSTRPRALVLGPGVGIKNQPVKQERTWGSFAIPLSTANSVIDAIEGGSLIYVGVSR